MSPLLLTAAAFAGVQRFALLAGANDGGPGRSVLRYAVSDAEAMAAVLNELGGVAESDTFLLVEPDRSDLEVGWEHLRSAVEAAEASGDRTEVVVYYSGHSDAEGLLLSGEHYGYSELRQTLDAIPADMRLLVLDSCSSGAVVRSKGGTFQPSFLQDTSSAVSGYAYLTSSSADEVSQEAEPIGSSYFTHALISGLRGGADLDENRRITLSEAYSFAYHETLYQTERSIGGAQHARHDFNTSGAGDLVVTDLSATSARLHIETGLAGRLSVRDSEGRLIAEVLKPDDRPLELGLSSGDYIVLLDVDGSLSEARLTLSEDETVSLSAADFIAVGRSLAQARGDDEYLDVPFSVGVLPMRKLRSPEQLTRHHLDLSLGVAAADRLVGMQLSLGGNVITEQAHGVQIAGGMNYAGGGSGVQLSAGPNISGNHQGVQLSPTLNLASNISGAQVGLLNIARSANVQLGLLNIAEDADISLGLVSINRSGYNHLYVLGASADPWVIGVTYGGKRLYSLAEYSYRPRQSTFSLGLGWHQRIFALAYMDVDVALGAYEQPLIYNNPGAVMRARMMLGFGFKRLALFTGPTLHWPLAEGSAGPYRTSAGMLRPGDIALGGQFGIRL